MGLRLINRNTTPPGQFQSFVAETKTRIGPFVNWNEWMKSLRAHHKVNNLPVGANFEADYEDQLCKNLGPDWCEREGGGSFGPFGGRIGFNQVLQATATLADWFVTSGARKVDKAEADSRATICSTCTFNQEEAGCSSCNKGTLLSVANRIVGGQPTKYDHHLNSCTICGCSLKAKVWLPLEVLLRHISAQQQENFPEYCWLKKEPVNG